METTVTDASETDTGAAPSIDPVLEKLVEAALPHVAFDGWSPATFRAAVADSGLDPALADAVAPRGALDLALGFHRMGDLALAARVHEDTAETPRYRDKIARAVRLRIEVSADREVVRRGTTFFALPQNAPLGAKALWDTADAIWRVLGDTSEDLNWYTKRATLSGVYASTVLYWLGDESPDARDSWAFLDRRIEDVMAIEKAKAKMRETPGLRQVLGLKDSLFSGIRAPVRRSDIPGA